MNYSKTELEKRLKTLNHKHFELQIENRNLMFMIKKLEDKIRDLQIENTELYSRLESDSEEEEIDMDRIRMIMEKAKRMKKKNA